ncbi:MAG: PilZ domain-containing protein [Caulobacterales bacterium]
MRNFELDAHINALAAQLQPMPHRDRRRHRRVPVVLSGALMDHHGQEHHFDVIDVSAGGLRISTSASAPLGAKIILYCQNIGRLVGHVARSSPGQMALSMTLAPLKKEKLIETLTWQANKARLGLQDERRSERFNTTGEATCELQDGRQLACRVLDISLLGMSLATQDKRPHLGVPVTVGRHKGVVARYTENGFAVDFQNGLRGSDPLE